MPDRGSTTPTTRLTGEGYPMQSRKGLRSGAGAAPPSTLSMGAGDDLNSQIVGIEQVGGVVERPVPRPQTRLAVAAAAAGETGGVRAVNRDAPSGAKGDVAVAGGRRASPGDDPEGGGDHA